jgi:acetoacetyl-CoA synthetase
MPRAPLPKQVNEGTLLWEPTEDAKYRSNMARFMRWLDREKGLKFDGYQHLWRWSVDDLEGFWASIWDYFQVKSAAPYSQVLSQRRMPGARWFAGAELNYAEHALTRNDDHPALLFKSEIRPLKTLTYRQLNSEVASVAAGLRRLGVGKGDRVAALMPNIPETVVAFLATASIGAVWSACSPEFGARSVVERFRQIGPKVLLAVDGYRYRGRDFSMIEALADVQEQLPMLEHTVVASYLSGAPELGGLRDALSWEDIHGAGEGIVFEPVPFDHPLWVLYSSGTTGLPKPIVHGHGGILLEHLKVLSLHLDLAPDDRFFWFTTTGWMMWNLLVGGLLLGSTVVLYDGDPGHPDLGELWRFAREAGLSYFGASAPFIQACMKSGIRPSDELDLSALKGLGSTGAPLPAEGFRWVYEHVSPDLLLASFSGGTDMCTGFLGSCPLLPVHAGEIQCLCLGMRVEAYGPDGQPVVGQVGELVITEPAPSMPIYFWNDEGDRRYRESYFESYRGVWRHGDWIKITGRGTCVVYGRSDATLNRAGVRMGTSEFYRVVEAIDEVLDSLVVDTGRVGEDGRLLLFLVLREGAKLDGALRDRVRSRLRVELSPRHVADEMYAIEEVPKTLNGKKMELPVKKVLAGAPVEDTISRDSMSSPAALDFFADLALSLGRTDGRRVDDA